MSRNLRRFLNRRRALRDLTQQWAQEERFDARYGLWLIRSFGGRAFRLQLKVLDRRAQSQPARVRAARIHRAYRHRWRRSS